MRPLIEDAIGIPNGTRTVFRTSAPYKPGTVRVFLNGFVLRADYTDGWEELGMQQIQMKEPPQTGDTLQLYYVIA